MGIGVTPAASYCECDSELSSSSLEDSDPANDEVSTTTTQSYNKKSFVAPR